MRYKQSKNNRLQLTLNEMSTKISMMEQHLRENNIEINGIPEHKNEVLHNILIQAAKTVEIPLHDDDILHITRVAKMNKESSRPRTVVARLRPTRLRDCLLATVAKYNKKHPKEKISTRHLGYAGPSSPVYLNT